MLDCRNCGFAVTKDMGFSVRQNKCPACGSSLMSNDFLSEVKSIKLEIMSSRILSPFSVPDDALSLLGILIKNKFVSKKEVEEVLEVEDALSVTVEEDLVEEDDQDFESIRDEVRRDALSRIDEPLEISSFENEIERKKALARSNPFGKKRGVSVNRVSGA